MITPLDVKSLLQGAIEDLDCANSYRQWAREERDTSQKKIWRRHAKQALVDARMWHNKLKALQVAA